MWWLGRGVFGGTVGVSEWCAGGEWGVWGMMGVCVRSLRTHVHCSLKCPLLEVVAVACVTFTCHQGREALIHA